jgi:hypothetical protein
VVWPLEPCAEEIPEPPENPGLSEEPAFEAEPEPLEDAEPDDVPPLEPAPPPAAALPVPPEVVPLTVLACDDPGRA